MKTPTLDTGVRVNLKGRAFNREAYAKGYEFGVAKRGQIKKPPPVIDDFSAGVRDGLEAQEDQK